MEWIDHEKLIFHKGMRTDLPRAQVGRESLYETSCSQFSGHASCGHNCTDHGFQERIAKAIRSVNLHDIDQQICDALETLMIAVANLPAEMRSAHPQRMWNLHSTHTTAAVIWEIVQSQHRGRWETEAQSSNQDAGYRGVSDQRRDIDDDGLSRTCQESGSSGRWELTPLEHRLFADKHHLGDEGWCRDRTRDPDEQLTGLWRATALS